MGLLRIVFAFTLFVSIPSVSLAQEQPIIETTPPIIPASAPEKEQAKVDEVKSDAPLLEKKVEAPKPALTNSTPVSAPVATNPVPTPSPTPIVVAPKSSAASASLSKFSLGVASDVHTQSGVTTISPTLSISTTGQKLPNQEGSNLATSYHLHLITDPYKVSSLATSEDYRGQPIGLDFRFEGAVGGGLGVGPKRPCGGALLALFGIQTRGQAPNQFFLDGVMTGVQAGADADIGAQFNIACTKDDYTINAGPKGIVTTGVAIGSSVPSGVAIKDPNVMVGGNITVIRDGDLRVIAELLGKVHSLGLAPTNGADTRAKIAFDKKIKSILGVSLEIIAEDFKDIEIRGTASLVW